jgi:non-homologous end joining protein Ku
MMKLAQRIIRTKAAEFDPAMLEDHYRTSLVRILNEKLGKRAAPAPIATPSRENVINLIDALKRSIAAQDIAKKPFTARRAGAKHRTRQSG